MSRLQLRDSDPRWPGLTDLERLCAEEYMKDVNQTQAFMRAGGKVTTTQSAATQAALIFNRPRVRAYLKFLIEDRSRQTRTDSNWVLTELVDLYKEVRHGDEQDLRLAKDVLQLIGKHVDVSAFEEKVVHGLPQNVAPAQAVFVGVGCDVEEVLEGEVFENEAD